jgi:hypothetical protein
MPATQGKSSPIVNVRPDMSSNAEQRGARLAHEKLRGDRLAAVQRRRCAPGSYCTPRRW